MSFTADSRKPRGAGIFPLQHENFDRTGGPLGPWSVDMRSSVVALRITGRDDGKDGLGQWLYDPSSVGDIHGGQLLPVPGSGAARPTPMWRFATPAVISSIQGRTTSVITGPRGGEIASGGTGRFLPVYDDKYNPDGRLLELIPNRPSRGGREMWPKFPIDYFGISLVANFEPRQIDLFMPTDPRLIAANKTGDYEMGSLVCDLSKDLRIDLDRMARLQSMMRVLVQTRLCSLSGEKVIAWNVGPSGLGDTRGGYMFEARGGKGSPSTRTGQPVETGGARLPGVEYGSFDPEGYLRQMHGSGSAGFGQQQNGTNGAASDSQPQGISKEQPPFSFHIGGGGGAGGAGGGQFESPPPPDGGGSQSPGRNRGKLYLGIGTPPINIDGFGFGPGGGFNIPGTGFVPFMGNKGINIDGFGFGGGGGFKFPGGDYIDFFGGGGGPSGGPGGGPGSKGGPFDGFGFGWGFKWRFPPDPPYRPPFAPAKPGSKGPEPGVQRHSNPSTDPDIDAIGNAAYTLRNTMFDAPPPVTGERISVATGVAAMMSQFDSGLMEVGIDGDKHTLGRDADGHEIHSSHVSTNAYFYRTQRQDGPLDFGGEYQKAMSAPYTVKTHLRYDPIPEHNFACGPRQGLWRWQSECFYHEVPANPPVRPDINPPWVPTGNPPPNGPPGMPTNPPSMPGPEKPVKEPPPKLFRAVDYFRTYGGSAGDGWPVAAAIPGSNPPLASMTSCWETSYRQHFQPFPPNQVATVSQWQSGWTDSFASTHRQVAMPAWLGVPQGLNADDIDLRRYRGNIPSGLVANVDRFTPVAGRIEAFARTVGGEWMYTQRPDVGRYQGGTASGGFVLMPPEYDIVDERDDFTRPVSSSSTYFMAVPGAYFGGGIPNPETGGPRDGYDWGVTEDGDLVFRRFNNAGTATTVMTMEADGTVVLPRDSTVGMGTGTGTAKVKGLADVDVVTVGNVGSGEDDLMTYTLPANSMVATGDQAHVFAGGVIQSGVAVTLKFHFGASSITLLNAVTLAADSNWTFDGYLARNKSGNPQRITGTLSVSSLDSALSGTSYVRAIAESMSGSMSAASAIKFTGEATNDDDITQRFMDVEFYNS